ncbi:MAG: hypothetical protein EBS06_08955 [Proteobacteria bacterium]|nr:hypothetical protein [Pseudomonadota bacterium]
MKKIFLVTALFFVLSCTHENQKVRFDLTLDSSRSAAGNSKTINLKIFDDRLNKKVIGTKIFSSDDVIQIISEENLSNFLAEKISKNLEERGFKIGLDKDLEIHIDKLEYSAKRKFFIGKSEGRISIKVVVKNNQDGSAMGKNFNISLDNKHFIVPLESTDESTINALLQEAIKDTLDNSDILEFISR